ncbi:MAG TPA: TonB family protein [Gammaproteobacteria bacterium]|nr:TonB family protein [Gammaproteobacteria bacterium]
MALCAVSLMLWFALEVSGFIDRDAARTLETHAVDLLSTAERRELENLLDGGRPTRVPPLLEPTAIAPLDFGRALRGIVRLEVDVDAAGRVTDVRVLDAVPAGIYETQAIADARRREYTPELVAGRAVPSRRFEIVDFTVTPAAAAMAEAE